MRPRTVLYGRAPAALGAWSVESLSSYVARLCIARSLSVPDVFDRLVRPLVPEGLVPPRDRLSFYLSKDSVDLDGLGPRVDSYVAALGRLTNCPRLAFHTFLPWRRLLSAHSAGVILRSAKRWCPCCFAEWRQRALDLWEPLLWRVSAVRFCPAHRVPLAQACLACGRPQRIVSQTSMIGECERCGADLGCSHWSGGPDDLRPGSDINAHWAWWTALAVARMLTVQLHASDNAGNVGFAALIESARARMPRRSLDALAHFLGFSRSSLEAWRRCQRPLRLTTFLAVTMRLGANPVEVAFAPYGAALGLGWETLGLPGQPWPRPKLVPRAAPTSRSDPERWKTISAAFAAELREPRVCSPTQLAKSLQVAPATVRKRLPELYHQLSDRCRAQRDADRTYLREQRYQAVRDAVTSLVHSGHSPSRSRTFHMAGVYGLDRYDPTLRDVWCDAVRQHGVSPAL